MARDTDSKQTGGYGIDVVTLTVLFVVSLLVAIIFNVVFFVNTASANNSMSDTIMQDSQVLGTKMFGEPERLDIIVYKNPDDASAPHIKRIIGLPEETVKIIDGKIYINTSETPLDETAYVSEPMPGSAGPYFVPRDCYFVMGDNRQLSADEQGWGIMSKKDILAKLFLQIHPGIKSVK